MYKNKYKLTTSPFNTGRNSEVCMLFRAWLVKIVIHFPQFPSGDTVTKNNYLIFFTVTTFHIV